MTITVVIDLPRFAPDSAGRLLRGLLDAAAPVLLTAAIEASGMPLPARLLMRTALDAARQPPP